jgi:ferric-dicitrate binding protein FerR (iron transport regulator)
VKESGAVLDLVDGYLDGTIGDNQLADLERRLCDESGTRRLFWLAVNQEVLLRRHLSGAADAAAAERLSPGPIAWWRRAQVRWAVAALLMAMVGIATVLETRGRTPTGPRATITMVHADAGSSRAAGELIHSDGRSEPLHAGQSMSVGDRMVVALGADAEVRMSGEDTAFGIGHDAALSLSASPQGSRLVLERGFLTAVVAHQMPGKRLIVTTNQATVEVVGTRFTVAATADRTSVDVDEGRVKVASIAAPLDISEIGPGGRAEATTGQPVHAGAVASLAWSDHRPLGVLMLCKAAAGWPRNPRGWFNDDHVDISTAVGTKNLQDRIEASIDQCITNLRSVGAQGLVFWDIEGLEAAIGYVGDPRQLPVLAPEMDSIADHLMERVRQAGFAVGVAIRLDEVDCGHGTMVAKLRPARNPAVLVQERIAYAMKRWGATLFPLLGTGTEHMDVATVCRHVHAAYPIVLLIPTAAIGDADRWSAPWIQPDQLEAHGVAANPAGSMSVIAPLEDEYLMQHHDALVQAVAHGDVLTVRAWYLTPGHRLVHDIHDAAHWAPVP